DVGAVTLAMPCRSDPERVCDRHGLPEDLTAITGSSRGLGGGLVDTTSQKARSLDDPLVTEILDVLGQLAGSHPGFRPVHAKGSCAPDGSPPVATPSR